MSATPSDDAGVLRAGDKHTGPSVIRGGVRASLGLGSGTRAPTPGESPDSETDVRGSTDGTRVCVRQGSLVSLENQDSRKPSKSVNDQIKSPLMDAAQTEIDEVAALRALLLAGQRFRRAMADHFELSLSEAVLLGHLADAGGQLAPGELVHRMLVGSGTLTAVIDRLVEDGYVSRCPDPDDRRRVQVRLTPAGRSTVRFAQVHLHRALAGASGGSAAALSSLAAALDNETERVRKHRR